MEAHEDELVAHRGQVEMAAILQTAFQCIFLCDVFSIFI